MSEFSKLLSDAVAASGLTQADVEARTGIDRTVLSRLMSGVIAPSRSNLSALFSKFQPVTMVGHELVFAHLRDEAAAAGLPVEQLKIMLGDGQALREQLPASLVADLDLLALEAGQNEDYAALISDWATIIRRHHAALERKVTPFPSAAGPAAKKTLAASSKKTRHSGSDTAFPRGASQQPTA